MFSLFAFGRAQCNDPAGFAGGEPTTAVKGSDGGGTGAGVAVGILVTVAVGGVAFVALTRQRTQRQAIHRLSKQFADSPGGNTYLAQQTQMPAMPPPTAASGADFTL